MIIAGLDLSPTSSGIVKFILDENFEILEIKRLGFYGYKHLKRKTFEIPRFKDIISYDEDQYEFYNSTIMMHEHIFEFLKDCDYVAQENFAFNAMGNLTAISEFSGAIKFFLLKNGCKIRLLSPTQNKQMATGSGAHWIHKPEMEDAFNKLEMKKFYVDDLPEIPVHKKGKNVGLRDKDGISPRSDLIDAYFLAYALYNELLIRNNIKKLEELPEAVQKVLTHTTPSNKIPLIKQDFIEKRL